MGQLNQTGMRFIFVNGNRVQQISNYRQYATRNSLVPPAIAHPSKRSTYFNWKLITGFFLAGASLAFSETIFDQYSKFTKHDDDSMYQIKVQYKIKSNPLYQALINSKTDSWLRLDIGDDSNKSLPAPKNSLLGQFIAKPGSMMVRPLIFADSTLRRTVAFAHLGYQMCGYPFLIHGGVIATLLNESNVIAARISEDCSRGLKKSYHVQSLDISYRYPTLANQVVVIETFFSGSNDTDSTQRLIESRVLSEKGQVLVESKAVLKMV